MQADCDPQVLDRRLIGILKHVRTYGPAYRALFTYPFAEVLAALATPTLVCVAEAAVFAEVAPRAAALVAGAELRPYPSDAAALAGMVAAFAAAQGPA